MNEAGVEAGGIKVTLAWETTADLDLYVQNLNAPDEITSYDKPDTYDAVLEVDQLGGSPGGHVENIKLPEDEGNHSYAIYVNSHDANDDEIEIPFTVVTQVNGEYKKFVKSWNFALKGESNNWTPVIRYFDRMVKIGVISYDV